MEANWIGLAVGSWVLISPWLLGFASISVMKWSNLLAGLIMVLANVWKIFGEKDARVKSDGAKKI